MMFKLFLERSFDSLYGSTVAAFPETKFRQHATDPIRIVRLNWTPFRGMKTLFVRGLAQNFDTGGGEYQPIITFKNVDYHETLTPESVGIVATDGNEYFLSPLSRDHDILCRCDCKDFSYRFNWYDHVDRSLYGRPRPPYQRRTENYPPANPQERPGFCKHLIKMFHSLEDSGLVI